MLENIPEELLYANDKEEDVTIIIGENGCGKSSLLGYLAKFHCERRRDVIGIANTIHDKFDFQKNNFYALKGSRGRRQTKETLKNALKAISLKENEQGLRNAARALKYIGFDPVIGFSLKNFRRDFESTILESTLISEIDKDNLMSILTKLKYDRREPKITWLEMDNSYYKNIESYSFTIIFPYETILKKLKIIGGIDIYLSRQNQPIPLLLASSGELSLITSIVFLSTIIRERNSVVLIDEPENSLHPKWQKEYVKLLIDIFYYYQPKIIIATHSPIILNGAELFVRESTIYKANNFQFELQKKDPLNVEELLFRFFDITTPQNRFLSERIVLLLNLLVNGKVSIQYVRSQISRILENSYDPKQQDVLKEILNIASDLI